MRRTNAITKATRHAVRVLLKDTPYCPDYDSTDGTLSRVSCDNSATALGVDIRLDGQNLTVEEITTRIYHAAAHYACIEIGERSHAKSGRHNLVFEHALAAVEAKPYENLTHTQRAAIDKLLLEVQNVRRNLPAQQKHAYNRVTLTCKAEGCKTSLTIRESAAAKIAATCRQHAEPLTR